MKITKEQSVLIRAVAILMIVIYHFQYDMFGGSFLIERGQGVINWISDSLGYIQYKPSAWVGFLMSLCFIGVNVFFVLSGYSMVKKYHKRENLKLKHMGSQIMKILIPYWLAHPIIHVLDWGLKNLQYYFGLINYETHFAGMHSASQYIESLLVFPRWFSEGGMMTFVGTWWFVGIIIQFYILLPFLIKLYKKYKPIKVLIACVILSFIYRYTVSILTDASPVGINEANIWLFSIFPSRLAEFAMGMYLGLEIQDVKMFKKFRWIVPMILFGFLTLGNIYTMFISDFIFGVAGIMLLYKITKPVSGLAKRGLAAIGRNSYVIYLYHEPIMGLVLKFIFPKWIS